MGLLPAGHKYRFDEDGNAIRTAQEIESGSGLPDGDEEGAYVYYFGDSPKQGAMSTGTATLEADGEKHYYSFETSGSKGKIVDSGNDKLD